MKASPKSLLATLRGVQQERPALWLMRQAGRYLPEYRALRETKGGFLELCYDPEAAADLLLRGVASDNGQAWSRIAGDTPQVSPDTIRAIQTRLEAAGFYDGAIDGLSGPRLRAALASWRKGGFLTAGG